MRRSEWAQSVPAWALVPPESVRSRRNVRRADRTGNDRGMRHPWRVGCPARHTPNPLIVSHWTAECQGFSHAFFTIRTTRAGLTAGSRMTDTHLDQCQNRLKNDTAEGTFPSLPKRKAARPIMFRLRTLPLSAALLLLTFGAYLPLWQNGFVDYDDERTITANPHVSQGLTWSGFAWAWTTFDGVYWQPITWLSLQLDAQLSALRRGRTDQPATRRVPRRELVVARGQHAAAVRAVAAANGCRLASFLLAALFAVHPMHVESVAWAAEAQGRSQRLLRDRNPVGLRPLPEPPRLAALPLMAGAFALSLLAKPMLLTLPFVLLLLDYWPLGRLNSAPAGSRQALAFAPRLCAGCCWRRSRSWSWRRVLPGSL